MKLRLLNFVFSLATIATVCMQSEPAEAIFASVKSTGMAATSIAYPLDTLAGAYNPAGMTDVGDRLDVEAGWVHNTGSAHVSNNLAPLPPPARINGHFKGMRTKEIYPAAFGINKIFCFPDFELATGLVFYNRNYQKTTYNEPFVLLGTSNLGLEYLNQTISPIVAVKWCQAHTLGISIDWQVERVKVNGIENFDNPVRSVAPGHVTNRGYNYASGVGVTIGYLGHITEELSIGLTYQPKTPMSRLSKYKGFLAQRGKLDIPRKIGAGISYKVMPWLALAFDVEHIQWSKVRSLHNSLLHNGALEQLGSKYGPGFGFKDQWYFRVGADWQVNECWSVRGGFRHTNSPIRKSQTTVNLITLDAVEDVLTLGTTYNINPCNEISAVFAYGFQNRIKGENTIPPAFGGGDVAIKEQKTAVGIAWGYKF